MLNKKGSRKLPKDRCAEQGDIEGPPEVQPGFGLWRLKRGGA